MAYYFASDVHIGLTTHRTVEQSETLFVSWLEMVNQRICLEGLEQSGIFLLGDIFDFWFEHKRVIPGRFLKVLSKLKELTQKGIKIWFIVGNHDKWSKGYLEREVGLTMVYSGEMEAKLYGIKFFLAHGDKAYAKYYRNAAILFKLFNSKLAYNLLANIIHPDIAMWLGDKWSESNRKKKRLAHIFASENETVVKYAREIIAKGENDIRYFIFGHLHCPVSYSLSATSQLFVLGHWIEGDPIYGVFDGKNFILKSFSVSLPKI